MALLTIITPTYNRENCLGACMDSLLKQTVFDFQWLVVDDGSTDGTAGLVRGFADSNPPFAVDLVQKANGGKHTALNASHPYIKGDYVTVLDSDDTLVPNAVERILAAWSGFACDPEVGRIIFLKGTSVDEPVCRVLHPGVPVDTLKEPRIGSLGRDCCDTFRTALFTKYRFPEFEGERFIGEGAAFFPMELESKGVYYNEVLYLCSYREDGLTKAGRRMRIQNPRGGMYNSKTYMHPRLPLKTRVKKGILYSCYAKFAGVGFKEMLRDNPYRILTALTRLPGLALAHYWKRKHL
ncbi:MAG: glycosyltransferase family 2 protein [Clostridia bacterium]|nr:glycosyltransferase family 2 protein [Clostridia bacterium]